MSDRLLTITLGIDRDGTIHSRTQTHESTFGEAYRSLIKLREELDRQIASRKLCPANPKFGQRATDSTVSDEKAD